MASADGSILIRTKVDNKGLQQGMSGITSSMKKLGAVIASAFVVKKLVDFGKQAVNLASDIQEVQNVVDTAFGSMAYKMEEFAKTSIETYGISKLTAKQTGSIFMAMGRGMSIAEEDASNMAIALTGLSADMASFYNVEQSVASTALKSVFTGETETLKQFGIVMTEANLQAFALSQGITKSYQAMSQAEKVQLKYAYVMNQTAIVQGDFAKTSSSWANQTRILSERWKEFLSIAGSGLIQTFTPVLKLLNSIMSAAIGAISALSALFGWNIEVGQSSAGIATGIEEAVDAENALGESAKKTGKALKGQTAYFDDLKTLSTSGGGAGCGAGGGGGGVSIVANESPQAEKGVKKVNDQLERMKKLLSDIEKIFKAGFIDGMGKVNLDDLRNSFRGIGESLRDIFTDSDVNASAQSFIKKFVYAMGQYTGALFSIGVSLSNAIFGGIDTFLSENSDSIKEKIISMFNISGDIFSTLGNLSSAFAEIFSVVGEESGKTLVSGIIGSMFELSSGILEIGLKIGRDLINSIATPIIDNKELIRDAFSGIIGVLSDIVNSVKNTISSAFGTLNKVYDEKISPFIQSVGNGLSTLLNTFLTYWNQYINPVLSQLAERLNVLLTEYIVPLFNEASELIGNIFTILQNLWEGLIVPFIDWFIEHMMPILSIVFSFIGNTVATVFEVIAGVIKGLLRSLNGILVFLSGVFTMDWKKAFDGLSMFMQGFLIIIGSIWSGFKELAKGAVNFVIGNINGFISAVVRGINSVIDAMNSINVSIPDWVPGLGGKTFGINIGHVTAPQIPLLAQGAVIPPNREFLAVLGDQKSGTNIETPLSTMIEAFQTAMGNMGINGGQTINLQIDGRTLAKLSLPSMLGEMQRQGYDVSVLEG